MRPKIIEDLDNILSGISGFLVDWLSTRGGFESRSFYGETFTLSLLSQRKLLTNDLKQKLLDNYNRLLNEKSTEFHWEFNNYALTDYYYHTKDIDLKKHFLPLNFKGTNCTNWTLLRNNVQLRHNPKCMSSLKEALNKLKKYQLNSGLILDDIGVKSFQYHAFSAVMSYEIYLSTNHPFFLASFLKATSFIRRFILPNGDSMYIGRGQNQSFGYGVLIYLLSIAYNETLDSSILNEIVSIIQLIKSFQDETGALPLVLNTKQIVIPYGNSCENPITPGWYAYNNFFDYLPFLGFFLNKSLEQLNKHNLAEYNPKHKDPIDYSDKDFRKKVTTNYIAILSRPGGYWTNDMPIPYIFHKGKSITPCYGGEQFVKSIYSTNGLALPIIESTNNSIRRRSISFFILNYLILFSLHGIMIRRYLFQVDKIIIETKLLSPFSFIHNYLFITGYELISKRHFKKGQVNIYSSSDLIERPSEYSASGLLKRFCTNGKKHTLTIHLG